MIVSRQRLNMNLDVHFSGEHLVFELLSDRTYPPGEGFTSSLSAVTFLTLLAHVKWAPARI